MANVGDVVSLINNLFKQLKKTMLGSFRIQISDDVFPYTVRFCIHLVQKSPF